MASLFLYHVVGDLTVGKPEFVEFEETETVEAAILAIGESTEGGIPVWRKASHKSVFDNAEIRQNRFVGILDSLDIVAFLARDGRLEDQEKAMKTRVSEVVVPCNSLLKVVDPATRLIDALEMMKHGVKRLLVRKSVVWKGMSKRFSFLYHGKWLKHPEISTSSATNINSPSSSSIAITHDTFCCLSREDVIRWLIDCLGALAPLPLSPISSLGAINPNYDFIEASLPAMEAAQKSPQDPSAVAVVEITADGQRLIIGEVSACKLWKCNYLAAAWALANLSGRQFVMGVEDNVPLASLPDLTAIVGDSNLVNGGSSTKPRKFSSRSIGFFNNPGCQSFGVGRSMYRGRSSLLTCKVTTSLAAVMAQMLSHRATHVWVTDAENEDVLVGVMGYAGILAAVTRKPAATTPETPIML